jgi:hypothetical protein
MRRSIAAVGAVEVSKWCLRGKRKGNVRKENFTTDGGAEARGTDGAGGGNDFDGASLDDGVEGSGE